MFVARDPRVPREARFTLGYYISRLQRFDSTRCALIAGETPAVPVKQAAQ